MHTDYKNNAKNVCVFCEPDASLIIQTTKNFLLMYDPFALVPGHILITSREHYGCLGEVPIHLQEEVSKLRMAASDLLDKAFQSPITRYEHGRAGHCLTRDRSTRSCHHYHEHLIPAQIPMHDYLLSKYKCLPFQNEEELCILYERYGEYLLVCEPNAQKRFYVAKSKRVEPHLLRTLSAISLGYPERQNWEDYTSCETLIEGKAILSQYLQECAVV